MKMSINETRRVLDKTRQFLTEETFNVPTNSPLYVLREEKYNTLPLLTEAYDRKVITEVQFISVLEGSIREDMKLLNEALSINEEDEPENAQGFLDKVKSGVDSITQWVNDKILSVVLKILNGLHKAKGFLLKFAGSIGPLFDVIIKAIEKFKAKHPYVYKSIVCILVALMVLVVMSIMSESAHAAVKSGNETIDNAKYITAMKAKLGSVAASHMMDDTKFKSVAEAMQFLDKASATKDVMDAAQLSHGAQDVISKSIHDLDNILAVAKQKHIPGVTDGLSEIGNKIVVVYKKTVFSGLGADSEKSLGFSGGGLSDSAKQLWNQLVQMSGR